MLINQIQRQRKGMKLLRNGVELELNCLLLPSLNSWMNSNYGMFGYSWSHPPNSIPNSHSHSSLNYSLFINSLLAALISFFSVWVGPRGKEEREKRGLVSFLRSSQGSQAESTKRMSWWSGVLPRRWAASRL